MKTYEVACKLCLIFELCTSWNWIYYFFVYDKGTFIICMKYCWIIFSSYGFAVRSILAKFERKELIFCSLWMHLIGNFYWILCTISHNNSKRIAGSIVDDVYRKVICCAVRLVCVLVWIDLKAACKCLRLQQSMPVFLAADQTRGHTDLCL